MNGFLIDTNVLSELRRPKRDPAVVEWFAGTEADDLYVSVLTLGEIRQGIESLRSRDARAAQAIERWLHTIRAQFEDRLLPVDEGVANRWGRLPREQPIPAIDGLLAATALQRDLIVATRNVVDFERTGARCINPFHFQSPG